MMELSFVSSLIGYGFMAIPWILQLCHHLAQRLDHIGSVFRRENELDQEFDFIVVGAGSAGAVVANRLSKKYSVLVLEAGGDPSYISNIPYFMQYLLGSHMDYQYTTAPQKYFEGSSDKRMKWPRGQSLGGSSSINSMHYLRGNSKDFDEWATLTGDDQWSYRNLLPFFKKSEDYNGFYSDDIDGVHGKGGELYVGQVDYEPPGKRLILDAFREKGFAVQDLNARQNSTSFMAPEVTTKRGRRWGTYQAFLKPILSRKSLYIYRYSKAQKIHLDERNRAVGVTYLRHGRRRFARATKEIIVSCGSTDSPKLLMLSGIGPKDHLESVHVKPIVNLPVGQNLIDHPATGVTILFNSSISFVPTRDFGFQDFYKYFATGKGPLSSVLQLALGFTTSKAAHSNMTNSGPNTPDLYFLIVNQGVPKTREPLESYHGPYAGMDAHRIAVALPKPKSKGKISLASNDPNDPPLIDPNYFEDSTDLSRLVEAIKFIVNFYETSETLKKYGARLPPNHFPGCEAYSFRSTEYWEC